MSENQIIAQLRRHVDDYIEKFDCYGVNGYGRRLPFFPEVALIDFWTVEKITAVLCHDEDPVLHSPEVILEHYLVVFSILVLTSKAANLDLFTQLDLSDKSLPLEATPKSYRDSLYNNVFESFMDLQWKFCPMSLYLPLGPKPSKRTLLPDVILPILGKEKINSMANEETNTVVLYKAELHRLSIQKTVPVVFKEYLKTGQESQRLFDNESTMYSYLREDSFDHIARYYGSFSCLGRRTIVLEHAPGGDLLSFFRGRKIPKTDWHRKQFWQNIFGLLEGLVAIDDVTRHHLHSKDTWHLRGTHQDIRPQNILLCGYPSDDDYSVPFKFADMGTAHIRKVKTEGIDRHAVDQFGNGMYSAPEAYRDNGVATGIGHKSDVYSLGGILSETLIWSIWGERGRETYQAERVEATCEFKLKGGFHEGAFHDGDGLLHVVEKWHDRAVALTHGKAGALSQLILKSMLAADPERRQTAAQVIEEFKAVIPTLESDSEPQDYIYERRQGWPLSPLSLATRSRTTPAGSGDATEQSPTPVTRIGRISSMQATSSSIAPFLTASPDPMEPSMSPLNTPTHENMRPVDALHIGSHSDPQFGLQNNSSGAGHKGKLPASSSLPSQHDDPFVDESSTSPSRANGTSLPIRTEGTSKKATAQDPGPQSARMRYPISTPYSRSETHAGGAIPSQHLLNRESSFHVDQQPNALQHAQTPLPRRGMTLGSGSRQRSQRQTSSEPPITIDQIWRKCFGPGARGTHYFSRSALGFAEDPLKVFPVLRKTLKRLKGNHGRNQIFIVDDSKSMEAHQEQVARTCRVLTKLLKRGQVDPDKEFELFFASEGTPIRERNGKELQLAVQRQSFASHRCEMHTILDQVASRVIEEEQPVSIYVLTNGHWDIRDPDSICDVEQPIVRLVKHIVNNNKQSNWAMVQFISFFKDPPIEADEIGKARLKYLDNDLKADLGLEKDIVDTRNSKKDVRKILLGPLSPEADESPSESD